MIDSVAESTKCGPRSADFLLHIGFSCTVYKILDSHYQRPSVKYFTGNKNFEMWYKHNFVRYADISRYRSSFLKIEYDLPSLGQPWVTLLTLGYST